MKKGFTLIELLAVIVLLGILSVIVVPKIGDSITTSQNQAYNAQIESIKKGVTDFLIDNSDIVSVEGPITIKLGAVKQGGYLPVEIKNPITKKSFSNESRIYITSNAYGYDIELDLFDVEAYNESLDKNAPVIALNGNYIEYVEVYGDYDELGVLAFDNTGSEINDVSIQINDGDTEIDTSILGTNSINYSVTDSEGRTSFSTRTVIVRDSTPPIITVPKDTTIHVSEVADYDLTRGVIATDNYDNSVQVNYTEELEASVGKYVITYTATDSNSNTSTVRRVINVTDNT